MSIGAAGRFAVPGRGTFVVDVHAASGMVSETHQELRADTARFRSAEQDGKGVDVVRTTEARLKSMAGMGIGNLADSDNRVSKYYSENIRRSGIAGPHAVCGSHGRSVGAVE
jgi:hypothetical protein